MDKKERIEQIFIKLKKGHNYWKNGDMFYQKRLEKAFKPLFKELETLGVDRSFSESLLFFGKEFVDSILKDKMATTKDAEVIFGVKSTPLTDKQLRESELAKKSNALIYRSLPMKGDKVGIKVLASKLGG